jgi:hypothetical protein
MERANERLAKLQSVVEDPASEAPQGLSARVERLQSWHNKARRLMPLVSTFLKM